MFRSRKRSHPIDIWPGFVDALATVLMVIIFVLMTFVVAQLYLTEALNTTEEHASSLEKKINDLQSAVDEQHQINLKLRDKSQTLDQLIQELNEKLAHVGQELAEKHKDVKLKTDLNHNLLSETEMLKNKIDQLLGALSLYETTHEVSEKKINSLLHKMNLSVVDHLHFMEDKKRTLKALASEKQQIENQKNILSTRLTALEHDQAELLKDKAQSNGKNQFDHYRSEFFSRLLKILGNRPDIRVVGDRFVFQSEVLFDKASADLGELGKNGLDALVKAIEELQRTIPSNVSWILRVDGHTDQRPINSTQFPSNWELSSARSIAVVKYLVSKGISPERLVAAGFGEHQPLAQGINEAEFARNRRIEFKLDQK